MIHWTKQQLDYIAARVGLVPVSAIARELGHAEGSIRNAIAYYGLHTRPLPPGRTPPPNSRNRMAWTGDEQRRLERMIGEGRTYTEIAAALGRSVGAVMQRKRNILPGTRRVKHGK